MGKLSPAKLLILAGVLTAPALGGPVIGLPISAVSVATVSAVTEAEVAWLILASGVAITLILSVIKGYDIETKYNGASMC